MRPSTLPEWAVNNVTLPVAQIPNKIQPTLTLRQVGYDVRNKPQAEEENYWRNLVYLWIQHFDTTLMGSIDAATLDGIDSTGFVQTGAAIDATTLAGQPASFYRNADTLDGIDSTGFLRTGASIDADTLDGISSSGFLRTGANINADTLGGLPPSAYLNPGPGSTNADTLDGLDSTAFVLQNQFNLVSASPGYVRLPNGLLIQWGRMTNLNANSNGIATINFPIAFTSGPLSITVTEGNNATNTFDNVTINTDDWTNTSFNIQARSTTGAPFTVLSPAYIAVGV